MISLANYLLLEAFDVSLSSFVFPTLQGITTESVFVLGLLTLEER